MQCSCSLSFALASVWHLSQIFIIAVILLFIIVVDNSHMCRINVNVINKELKRSVAILTKTTQTQIDYSKIITSNVTYMGI